MVPPKNSLANFTLSDAEEKDIASMPFAKLLEDYFPRATRVRIEQIKGDVAERVPKHLLIPRHHPPRRD